MEMQVSYPPTPYQIITTLDILLIHHNLELLSEWSKKKVKAELSKENNVGNTSLSLAVKNSHHDIVRFLIANIADSPNFKLKCINHVNNAKQPILFIPCWNNDIEMVDLLLEFGADVNYQDSRGWTPLMIAATQGYEDMIEFLIVKGANLDIKDKYGKKAADKAKSQNVFFLLSSAGIDTRMRESQEHVLKFSSEKPLGDLVSQADNAEDYQSVPVYASQKKTEKVIILIPVFTILGIVQ